jgi:2-polyprenyl-3-methyl-5-hydroxy-6-metoxy-1,4-benzoquinol methylase
MSDPVLRALLVKPGGVVRLSTITTTAGVPYLNYKSQKLLSSGNLVTLAMDKATVSLPRKVSEIEKKQASEIVVDGTNFQAKTCFDIKVDNKSFVVIPV